ncbi:S8 family peptidase [Pseudofulvibacter geojedonensis]|uniref:S8 family peptidase n=1 Tax=Pseudofulvibacter geojedonensis TaxID=1123758 RepID=A0ABW3I0U4_9FLAO
MMKPLFLSATTALILASCGSSNIVSTPISNIDNTPLKVTSLSEKELEDWGHKDLVKDTIPGMSVDKAYEFLKGKKGKTVVVAVVDSGVDIEHEDLKNVLWTNKKEIKGNNKDDDNNGYVDDIHGWNFLGDSNAENLEYVRILKNKSLASAEIIAKAQAEYDAEYQDATGKKAYYEGLLQKGTSAHEALTKHFGSADYTKEQVAKLETTDEALKTNVDFAKLIFSNGVDSLADFNEQVKGGVDHFDSMVNNYLNLNSDFRKVVGDNPNDINDKVYGNGNVIGPEKDGALHGTHVAGIIGAERNNGKGMNGVAHNVELMAVRAVPDGDEYDKDIALAFRYAVDNGAKVINTSFGKYYSPHSQWVRDAIKYAADNDVLIVNAAGNDAKDLDTTEIYPNDQVSNGPEISDNFLTVGALNYKYGSELVANFSNYGKINVDVFAPGVKIYATVPNNKYKHLQGTSMASPNVAGVAALIRSYYPKLKAGQVKQILMDSGLPIPSNVILGGDTNNKKAFKDISTSGKIVNAYNALIMAEQMSKK